MYETFATPEAVKSTRPLCTVENGNLENTMEMACFFSFLLIQAIWGEFLCFCCQFAMFTSCTAESFGEISTMAYVMD
jgi:hypothetical protein